MQKNIQIHIGKIIKQHLVENGKTAVCLAEQCHCSYRNFQRIFEKEHIHPELLLRISIILQHDFFKYYSDVITEKL